MFNSYPFRIYFASLADYNNGKLHGIWIDFDSCESVDGVWNGINNMLSSSPFANSEFAKLYGLKAQEFAIHNYELPDNIDISENEDINQLWKLYECLDYLEKNEIEPFIIYINSLCKKEYSIYTIKEFRNSYQGKYNSKEDFAYELVEDVGLLKNIPDDIKEYFDYESYARDLFIKDYWIAEGYVFKND